MKELLIKLEATKVVKVTGSFADGSQTDLSDIDFYVKPDHPDWKLLGKTRNIEKVKAVLDEFGIKMESNMTGYWYTHKSFNSLNRQLEFSDLFQPRKGRLPEVIIEGVEFKTY
jgi:uridine kinase